MVTMPVLVLLANTGIVMLYGDVLSQWLDRDVRSVAVGSAETSLDAQLASVKARFPSDPIREVKTAAGPRSPTVFVLAGPDHDQLVFVDPYAARVLGARSADEGFVEWARRLHAFMDVDAPIVNLPTPAAVVDGGSVTIPISLSDALLEVAAGWAVVLVLSGVVLWRRPRDIRRRSVVAKRAKWRRLHASPGIVLAGGLLLTLLTGLLWSTYWGATWRRLAEVVTPSQAFHPPDSPMMMDHHDGDHDMSMDMTPRSLNDVAAVAATLHVDPGYRIILPVDGIGNDGETSYGAFEIRVDWPDRSSLDRSYYVDQFTGSLLAVRQPRNLGVLARATEIGKQTHVGVEFGIVSRIVLTVVCVGVDWSVVSALLMWGRRRRRNSGLALPRRPIRLAQVRSLRAAAVAMGAIFPLWGASAIAVWALDRGIIRRLRRPRSMQRLP
jgi:uncharacterized iron-regulated membrane protein